MPINFDSRMAPDFPGIAGELSQIKFIREVAPKAYARTLSQNAQLVVDIALAQDTLMRAVTSNDVNTLPFAQHALLDLTQVFKFKLIATAEAMNP